MRDVVIPNRVAMSPMCMYSATDGVASDFHLAHAASRAAGGAGLVVLEATAVSPEGRITPGDLGLWKDAQTEALRPVVDAIRSLGTVAGIQLSHAGRKGGRAVPWHPRPAPPAWDDIVSPGNVPFIDSWVTPHALEPHEILAIVDEFAHAARRAVEAGFEIVELHAAHGYLIHQFLSPLSNPRTDDYGGTLAKRAQFLRNVIRAVRAAIPVGTGLFVRMSVVDWVDGGFTIEDSVEVARWLREDGADLIDCSSGAVVPGEIIPVSPGYHAPFAARIRRESGVPTGVVGAIRDPELAARLIDDGAADLIFLGRALLKDPYWVRAAARTMGAPVVPLIPMPYRRAVERMDEDTAW